MSAMVLPPRKPHSMFAHVRYLITIRSRGVFFPGMNYKVAWGGCQYQSTAPFLLQPPAHEGARSKDLTFSALSLPFIACGSCTSCRKPTEKTILIEEE